MNLSILILALMLVESGGELDPDNAKGDYLNGLSLVLMGCLQIWECVVISVNEAYGTNYTHEDMFNREDAIEVFKLNAYLYCNERRLGRPPTMKDAALMFHYGPKGSWIPDRHNYWEDVKACLN